MKRTRKLILALVVVMSLLMAMAVAIIPASAASTDKIVFFTKPDNWSSNSVKVYAWKGSGTTTVGAWPGTSMKYLTKNEYGQEVYYLNVKDAEKVIFSNGSVQSADITLGSNYGFYTSSSNPSNKFSCTAYSYTPNFYVAGAPTLCGEGWDTAADKMTYNATNKTATITFSNVGKGTHEYKITNGTWDVSWGNGSNNYSVTTTYTKSKVTIIFDFTTETATTSVECDHTYNQQSDSVASPATCTANKFVYAKCECGDVSNTVTIEVAGSATDHTIVNGDCPNCEETISFEEAITGTGTVVLNENKTYEGNFVVPGSVTIDLGGHDITATGTITFDPSTRFVGNGRLFIPKEKLVLSGEASSLPVWHEAKGDVPGHYTFNNVVKQSIEKNATHDGFKVLFRPSLGTTDVNEELFTNGVNGYEFLLYVYEVTGETYTLVTDSNGLAVGADLIQDAYKNGKAIGITITGAKAETTYAVKLVVKSNGLTNTAEIAKVTTLEAPEVEETPAE